MLSREQKSLFAQKCHGRTREAEAGLQRAIYKLRIAVNLAQICEQGDIAKTALKHLNYIFEDKKTGSDN